MNAEEMAAIHAAAMDIPAPWSNQTFQGFLDFPGAILAEEGDGFALGRVIADEAELLTVAVRPEARRRGIAARCLLQFERDALRKGATRAFLEVAETNAGARALYVKAGYCEDGRRPRYYTRTSGDYVDAILMSKALGTA